MFVLGVVSTVTVGSFSAVSMGGLDSFEETNVPFFLVLYFKLLNISSDISERKEFQSLNTIIEVQNMLFSEPIIL